MTVQEKVAYFKMSLSHERQVVAWLESRKAPRTLDRRTELGWFRAAVRWHTRLLARYSAKLPHPAAHLAFWTCVHNGEGAWDSQTGNGYYGGLQMTYGWAGLVTNAALLSPADQIRAAEEGFRRSGYSVAWLLGQWPNTSPPCLGLL